jgi:hypothetical protein
MNISGISCRYLAKKNCVVSLIFGVVSGQIEGLGQAVGSLSEELGQVAVGILEEGVSQTGRILR